jgi:hypothetical protein
MKGSDRLRRAIAAHAFPPEPSPEANALARSIVSRGGQSVLGIVFFGSRKTRAGPDPWSGYDLFVLTRDYRDFYRSLKAASALRRRPLVVAALNSVLPPNQISLRVENGEAAPLAKCAVVSLATFLREASSHRRDHFCVGRLFQPTEVLYSRDETVAGEILDALVSAHVTTLSWVRPWLPETFDADAYSRVLLQVSLGREIRPEPPGRAEALWQAQSGYLASVYSILLQDLEAEGQLKAAQGSGYSLAHPVSLLERLGIELYFRRSTIRATARWFKYVVTFDDWLEYIVRKAERHSGEAIALSARERALPLVFLWPRLIRYLRRWKR